MIDKDNLKIIEYEEDYYLALKEFKRKMWLLHRNIKQMTFSPDIYLSAFNDIMDECEYIKLFDKEFCDKQKATIVKELTSPTRFNLAMKTKIENILKRFRK